MEHIGRPRLYTDVVKVTVRMERRLAKALQDRADEEDVSRNILIGGVMASYLWAPSTRNKETGDRGGTI